MVGYIVLVAGFFSALSSYGLPQALAFAGLWFLFGMFMLGIPTLVGIFRTLGTFNSKELLSGLAAQIFLVAVLYGLLLLVGIQKMFSRFLIGGILVGLAAPQQSLMRDRADRIQLNADLEKKE